VNSHMSRHTTNNPDQPQIHKAAVPNTAVRSSAVTTGCATSLATMNRTGKETTTHAMKNTPRTGPHTVRTSDQTCDHVGGTCWPNDLEEKMSRTLSDEELESLFITPLDINTEGNAYANGGDDADRRDDEDVIVDGIE
jgi:hypothetical protein